MKAWMSTLGNGQAGLLAPQFLVLYFLNRNSKQAWNQSLFDYILLIFERRERGKKKKCVYFSGYHFRVSIGKINYKRPVVLIMSPDQQSQPVLRLYPRSTQPDTLRLEKLARATWQARTTTGASGGVMEKSLSTFSLRSTRCMRFAFLFIIKPQL